MSDKTELLPCECGGTDTSIGYESPQGYWVECGDCGHKTAKAQDRELAVSQWNRRAALAQQPAPVAVTEQMVDAAIRKAHGYQADHLCREFYRLVVEGAFAAAPAAPDGWQPKIVSGPGRSIFYGGNTNEHLNRPVVLLYADEYEKLLSTLAAPAAPVAVGQEPVAWRVSDPDEPEIGHWLSEEPGTSWQRSEPLYTAPPAAEQPDAVKVPRELLADLISQDHDTRIQAERRLYAMLAEENKA